MWPPETEKVLNIISQEERIKDYVFVGGSALSYYLNHRLSEDILATEKTPLKNNLNIANLDTLIGMKTAVIHRREVIRDYYDIYVITKEFGLEKAINEANRLYNKKVDGREYFKFDETDFFKYAVDLNGVERENVDPELAPKYKVNKEQIESFLKEEIKKYTLNKFNMTEKELPQHKHENNPFVNQESNKPDAFTQSLQNKPEHKIKFGR